MYDGNKYVTSELISSYAWDTALNFMCQNSEQGYKLSITTDKLFGNMYTKKKELTGMYTADKYSNIHDILGNCWEWTTEYYSGPSGPSVPRGGYCYSYSTYASYRYHTSMSPNDKVNLSFRTQLYLK